MITELEKLQDVVKRKQASLEKLQVEKEKSEAAVSEEPNNKQKALEVATLDYQIRAMVNAVKNAEDALRVEEARLASPEAELDISKLKKLNADMKKKQNAITKALMALNKQFVELKTLGDEAQSLGRKYSLNPFNWEKGGFLTMRGQILRWVRMRQAIERRAEIDAMPNQGVKRVNHKDTRERRKMLKKRFDAEG